MEAAPAAPFRPSVSECKCLPAVAQPGPSSTSPSWTPRILKKRTKEECASIPTSLVYPFLALPPTSWASPPTFSKLVCVFVYLLTSYSTRGSKEDKLVSGLLSPFLFSMFFQGFPAS